MMKVQALLFLLCTAMLMGLELDSSESFFKACDLNDDKKLSSVEFRTCMVQAGLLSSDGDNSYMLLVDNDNDGYISMKEYSTLVDDAKKSVADHKVTLTNRFGQEETITMEELSRRSEQMYPDFSRENGKMVQRKSATARLDAIAKDSPDIARYINIAKWAHAELVNQGIALGSIAQVRSLPSGGSVNRRMSDSSDHSDNSEEPYNQFGEFKLWLEMSIKPNISVTTSASATSAKRVNKPKGTPTEVLEFYEVEVERNRSRYARPHLALLQAWRLDAKGHRSGQPLSLRPPKMRFWTTDVHEQLWLLVMKTVVIGIVLMVTWWLIRKIRNSSSSSTTFTHLIDVPPLVTDQQEDHEHTD